MCFSAEADLVAGVVVSTLGIDAFHHVRRPTERLLAVIPVVLGVHSLIETLVWWGAEGEVSETLGHVAAWIYLLIAFGVLPVLVPLAVGALEPDAVRGRTALFTAVGGAVAIALTYAVVRGPIEVTAQRRYLDYRVDLWHGGIIVTAYVAVTCGSMLMSQRSHVRWFGASNLAAACVLAWLSQRAFISLWCTWAAVTSVAIAVHLRREPADASGLVVTGAR